MEKISLNGAWKLFLAEEGERDDCDALTSKKQLEAAGFGCIKGTVPGNFELDMQAAGMLPELFYGKNVLEAQELEYMHLWYCRSFDYEAADADAFLAFDGIDTYAEIYLNGERIGSADNMLIPHEYPVGGKLRAKNELVVHIRPTALEAQKYPMEAGCTVYQKYNAGSLATRKAAHMFGWDIMPRLLSGGLWRDVYIRQAPKRRIEEVYAYTVQADSEHAQVWVYYRLNPIPKIGEYRLKISGVCGGNRFETAEKLWHNEGKAEIHINAPKLWWPKNMGEPNLYSVRVELLHGDEEIDCREVRLGIRTVRLERTALTDGNGGGEFRFYVNGKPMFVMGTNWVPLDAFHSRDRERLPRALALLDESGCNMVRCWGGNVYEDHAFFDFCDAHGIAVWQDFAMGCAAYPQTEDFCRKLRTEAEVIVKRLRGHASLALWAGDNECDEAITSWTALSRDPDGNVLTRGILPEVLRRHDPVRPYLPSSPYIDGGVLRSGRMEFLPEKHLWGPRDYFKGDYYRNSPAHFASETGYHGYPALESMEQFLSPEKLWPPMGNDEWLVHAASMELSGDAPYAYRIPLMVKQVENLWGEMPDTLERFVLASQLSQAEAVKYFIERFRYGKWRRTGIIWWNLLDGWPQFSDAVVDYYFRKKAAFDFIKRSQLPVCLMMTEPQDGKMKLVAANEYPFDVEFAYKVTDLTDGAAAVSGAARVEALSAKEIGEIAYDPQKAHFYRIQWRLDGKEYQNHYLSGTPPFRLDEYVGWMRQCGLLE